MTEIENWKPVVGYERRYMVSDNGKVRSLDREAFAGRGGARRAGKILSPFVDPSSGYLYVNLSSNGKVKKLAVHVIVLEAFVGLRPSPEIDACHEDGNRQNPKLSNLRWDTRAGNAADKLKHGTAPIGEKSWRAKLTEEQVSFILASDLSSLKLAVILGVASSTIRAVRIGQNWKHSTGIKREPIMARKMGIQTEELEVA